MTVGSSLRLVCVLRDNTQPPSYVFWYHDEQMINFHSTREVSIGSNILLSSGLLHFHPSPPFLPVPLPRSSVIPRKNDDEESNNESGGI
ncbi:hypothetical protein E2C01_099124 [Portunus trituberculatus]|uniref:Ig-like domain-containing protein n=1 Tax=Portunus trituberculatus TaxID=210409 RepID=A0A5B7KA12_PORTR|nr:hypothetical protein [Portunus trituberculatus]